MNELYGVICYWQWDNKKWNFVESFGIDDDGHCLTTPSTGGKGNDEWFKWLNKSVPVDVDLDEPEPIMGRAVTVWTLRSGIKLLGIHPPEWALWLTGDFYEKLIHMPDCFSLLEGGGTLLFGTENEVRKYITT